MADTNFEKTCQVKFWTQKVIPLVYDNSLSIIELIGKVIDQLNILIQNNNEIPDLIAQTIQEYITSGAIGKVVEDILANYILNVKYPPDGIPSAKGDGTADDTEAIQGTINYASAQGGGAVYFPAGKYLTGSLSVPSNVSLFGFDRYQTSLVLKSGANNPLISSNGTDFGIYKLTLDANMGVQVNNINVMSLNSQDVLLSELIINNGYHGIVYNGTGGHLQIDNIVFGNCVYNCANISGNSYVQMENVLFTKISSVSGVDIINISSNGGSYKFKSVATCPLCLSISGNDNFVDCLISGAIQNFHDSGLSNTIIIRGAEKKEEYSGDVDLTVQGNVGINANGAWSETINGVFSSVHSNGENIQVNGITKKTYETFVENVSGKKTINAQDIWLNPTNPLQYSTPIATNSFYDYIKFKDSNNAIYKIMVAKNAITFPIVSVTNFGAKGDGINDDTSSIMAAINSIDKGIVFFPPGTYMVSNSGTMKDVGINLHSNINLIGCGRDVSFIKAIDNSNIHVLNGNNVHNIMIKNLSIDGNSKTTTTSVHGIRFALATNILIDNVAVRNVSGYGIGFQIYTDETAYFENIYINNVIISNTGSDGIDFKNPGNLNKNIFLSNLDITNPGQKQTAQVCVDIRGVACLSNISCHLASDQIGIRFREGSGATTGIGGHYSSLTNFTIDNTDADNTSIGISAGNYNSIANGSIKNCSVGIQLNGDNSLLSNINVIDSTADGVRIVGDYNSIIGCLIQNTTNNSIRIYGSNNNITNNTILNAGTGIRFNSNESINNLIANNIFTQLTNKLYGYLTTSGSLVNNIGIKTTGNYRQQFTLNNTGVQTITLTHDLDIVPDIKNIQISVSTDGNVTDYTYTLLSITGVSATEAIAKINIATASSTEIGYINFAFL